ncbi:MAG: hypothetical protein B7Z37_00020 [Verrucomicrobia bacterium 12-59-8]|nr:MAG: hypothetical protein B7Z37_00020 [Verrucomicrobia bacterium 12-59-8]
MATLYAPPLTLNSKMLPFVAEVRVEVGRLGLRRESALVPALRRGKRLRSLQASLSIGNNRLCVEQVTEVIVSFGTRVWSEREGCAAGHIADAAWWMSNG